MDFIAEGFKQAVILMLSFNRDVVSATIVSLYVSFAAVILASAAGIPVGFLIGAHNFVGKNFLTTILNTAMSLPTVIVGLVLYSFFSRSGPFGFLALLYTPTAIIIGEAVLIFPIIAALSLSATESLDRRIKDTALTLGATPLQTAAVMITEGRFAFTAAVIAGFGRAVGEVGVAMMLGGNIRYSTRTMTTAIALETSKGEFGQAIALGIILLTVAIAPNFLFRYLQREVRRKK